MAVGDVINFQGNSATSFIPAAGVEIMVLKNFSGSVSSWNYGLFDGVNYCRAYVENSGSNTWYDPPAAGNKFGITNTLYYYNNSSQTTRRGFSGIQTK